MHVGIVNRPGESCCGFRTRDKKWNILEDVNNTAEGGYDLQ